MKVEAPPTQSLATVHVILSGVYLLYICLYVVDLLNPSSHTVTLRSTRALTEMSTRNPSGAKGQPVHKADSLTAVCELIV
jgi:hypothetical protein